MKQNAIRVFVLGMLASGAFAADPARFSIEPAEPKWENTISFIYRPDAAGAKLAKDQTVWAVITMWYPDRVEQVRATLRPETGLLRAGFTVPKSVSFTQAYFVTKDAFDGPVSSMIFTADGRPARGAWHQSMLTPFIQTKDYRDRAARELSLYPDNWAVYRDKWFVAQSEAGIKEMVKDDLAVIERGATDRPLAALYAMSYGHLLLGDEASSRAEIAAMVHRFRDESLTMNAIESYEYQNFMQHFTGPGPKEVEQYRFAFLKRNPGSPLSLSALDSVGSESIPVGAVEAVCNAWIQREERNPKPHFFLAQAWQRQRIKPEEALHQAEKAIDYLVDGQLRLHGDIYGKMTELYLPIAFTLAANIARDAGEYGKALAFAKAAERSGKQTDAAAYMAEAAVWEERGRTPARQAALRDAWRAGSQSAYDELVPLFENRGALDKFLQADAVEKRKAAPAFSAKGLDGRTIDSAQLRGKVIVANFWFTGCGPCKAEIPDLNRLVATYKGRDVVFLGFDLDENEAIVNRFLGEYPFDYTIVPHASKIAEQFGVNTYPSHVVIAPDGGIASFLVGGGDGRARELDSVIARLLRQ